MRTQSKYAILGFRATYRFLSNFYVEPDGSHVEGEYQRAKCARFEQRKLFHQFHDDCKPFLDPSQCKPLGNQVEIRPDWESDGKSGLPIKVEIMQFYVAKKFRDHPSLAEQLRATRGFYLEETNIWGDVFYGVDATTRKGQNVLGHILMEIRDSL